MFGRAAKSLRFISVNIDINSINLLLMEYCTFVCITSVRSWKMMFGV